MNAGRNDEVSLKRHRVVLKVTRSCSRQEVAWNRTISETPHVIATPRMEGRREGRKKEKEVGFGFLKALWHSDLLRCMPRSRRCLKRWVMLLRYIKMWNNCRCGTRSVFSVSGISSRMWIIFNRSIVGGIFPSVLWWWKWWGANWWRMVNGGA